MKEIGLLILLGISVLWAMGFLKMLLGIDKIERKLKDIESEISKIKK